MYLGSKWHTTAGMEVEGIRASLTPLYTYWSPSCNPRKAEKRGLFKEMPWRSPPCLHVSSHQRQENNGEIMSFLWGAPWPPGSTIRTLLKQYFPGSACLRSPPFSSWIGWFACSAIIGCLHVALQQAALCWLVATAQGHGRSLTKTGIKGSVWWDHRHTAAPNEQ